ncbi:MAG: diguanylate cyclase, partial [Gammaproteobacteria bacterium]
MNIRSKVTTLVATLFVALGVTAFLVARYVLMPSFAALEHSEAEVAMRRIQFALDRTFAQLALSVASWGNWTDAWRFAEDHNQTFAAEQVTAAGLRNLNVSTLIFSDPSGRFIASATLDLQTDQPLDLDFTARRALTPDFPWRANFREGRRVQGFVQTNRGILMAAAAPVLDGFGHGPARGMVIIGRLLTPREVEEIGAQAQAALSTVAALNPGRENRLVETGSAIQVFRSFEDVYGRPILTLRVDMPREITRRGYAAVYYAFGYFMLAAVMIVALLVVLLNRAVVNRLARVTRHAVAIGGGADPTVRLDFEGKDEIAVLAREFDRMVEHVVRLGYCDSLTGLANREQAHLRLDSALAAAHRQGRPLALMYVDLDNFKRINDTLGHGIGDEVLVTAAERLCSALRSGAESREPDQLSINRAGDLARLGGDEFMVVLPEIGSSEDAARVAERL